MPVTGGETGQERARTDEGLRTERETTNQALVERRVAEETADLVVERARDRADAVLDAARDEADDKLKGAPAQKEAHATVADARMREDEVVRKERSAADERLLQEREESHRALSRLLPLERGKTDRSLLIERARSDEALSKRDDFLGIVSHDLRNLLGGIVLSAGHLSSVSPANEVATSRIERYAARMNRLIGDLLDVASLDAGTFSVTPTRQDATPLITEAVASFHAAATESGVSLTADIAESPLTATFDHDRMLQVLANLVTNAIKFTPRGGAITVRGERAPEGVRVTVTDTGVGIAAGMRELVFERFWQVGKSDRRGLGLGLYISRSIVEAHGGKIHAESAPGTGTRIVVLIPGGERSAA